METKLKREQMTENGPCSSVRTIRSHYREIENRINEGKDEIATADSDKFMAIMNEVENMHQNVISPREQVADAEALLGLTKHLAASVKTHTTGGVSQSEFVSCLLRDFGQRNPMNRHSYNSRNISWRNIGFLVSPSFMCVPGCTTMIGPMKNKLNQRRLAVRAKRARSIGKARPKELEKTANEAATDTDRNILVMFEILKKKKKVRAENLILNRNSFARTVENVFALSFLIKDGRVRIDVDGNGSQVVVPTNGPSAEEIKSGAVKNLQFIFRFDFNDWKLMKTLVPVGGEVMPLSAKNEKCDQDFSPPEAIPSDAQVIHTAPVK